MKAIAILAFFSGLLLAVRVMLFGVQRRVDEEHLAHRKWPLALAGFLVVTGAFLYPRAVSGSGVTVGALVVVVLIASVVGMGAWLLVKRSAAIPSSDPEDDPRYRFQGHVARVTEPITGGDSGPGRIVLDFDGKRHELRAVWAVAGEWERGSGLRDSEVVIERVEGDVAYVEPWTAVEQRL
jgi:hypothetical protein